MSSTPTSTPSTTEDKKNTNTTIDELAVVGHPLPDNGELTGPNPYDALLAGLTVGNPLPDSGEVTSYAAGASAEAVGFATAEPPQNPPVDTPSSNGGFFSTLLGSLAGKIILSALAVTLLVLIIHALSSKNSSKMSPTKPLDTAQAAVAQALIAKAVSGTTAPLQAAGYSAPTIRQAQNLAILDYGTRVAEVTIVPTHTKKTNPLYVIGANAPGQYATLATINTKAYLSSLSDSPTLNDMEQNSAAVHGLTTEAAK